MGKVIKIELSDGVKVGDSIKGRLKRGGFKKFAVEFIKGVESSLNKSLHPKGIIKDRTIDKINNSYSEKITDINTGEVVRNVNEKLTDHKN